MIISFNSWIDKKDIVYKCLLYSIYVYYTKINQYFPKPYEHFNGNVKLELGRSNCETKSNLKKVAGVDTTNSAAKLNLGSLKAQVSEKNGDKLTLVPADLIELSSLVDNDHKGWCC